MGLLNSTVQDVTPILSTDSSSSGSNTGANLGSLSTDANSLFPAPVASVASDLDSTSTYSLAVCNREFSLLSQYIAQLPAASAVQCELATLRFPLFASFIINMVRCGNVHAAGAFFQTYCPDFAESHHTQINHLKEIHGAQSLLTNDFTRAWLREKQPLALSPAAWGDCFAFLVANGLVLSLRVCVERLSLITAASSAPADVEAAARYAVYLADAQAKIARDIVVGALPGGSEALPRLAVTAPGSSAAPMLRSVAGAAAQHAAGAKPAAPTLPSVAVAEARLFDVVTYAASQAKNTELLLGPLADRAASVIRATQVARAAHTRLMLQAVASASAGAGAGAGAGSGAGEAMTDEAAPANHSTATASPAAGNASAAALALPLREESAAAVIAHSQVRWM